MSRILITMPEERDESTESHFALRYEVDEHDGLEFAIGLVELGHEVFLANWLDLEAGEFTRMFSQNRGRFAEPRPVDEMDLIFAYKFRGHYREVARFQSMADRFEAARAPVINDPATIRHNRDKSYLWDLERSGIRVTPTYAVNGELGERLERGETLVLKPRGGECGKDVSLARSASDLARVAGREEEYLAQDFIPEVFAGERSLVFLGRQLQHAVLKHPAPDRPGEFRCNESLGGTVAVYQPTAEEVAFAVAVLDAYAALGYPAHFSRVDLIATAEGPMLMEAELTSPSMYANYARRGHAFGRAVAGYLERMLG